MSTGFYLLDNHVSRDRPRKSGVGRPWYPSRTTTLRVGVIHTAENLPDFTPPDMGAENVARYGAQTERASWHDTVDSDSWIRMLPHTYTAFHVKGYNSPTVGLEIATQAAKWIHTDFGWRLNVLDNTARWVAYCHQEHNFPIRLLTRAQVDAGESGFTFHSRLDPDRRTDPGDAFPWDYVERKAREMVGVPAIPPPFPDRGEWSPWAIGSIENMIEKGIMRGEKVGEVVRFNAKDPVTREEMAVALDRLLSHIKGGN